MFRTNRYLSGLVATTLAYLSLALGCDQAGSTPLLPPTADPIPAATIPALSLDQRATEKQFSSPGTLTAMSLMFDAVSDDDLRQLVDYPELAQLRLQECPRVTGEGLKYVAKLPMLQFLVLMNTPVDDAGLNGLANAPALVDLTLQRTRITGATLASLPAGLERLELGGRGIRAEKIGDLADFSQLKELRLQLLDTSLRALPPLKKLLSLEKLDLTGTAVDDEGLARLVGLDRLQVFKCDAHEITDQGVLILSQFTELTELDLATSQMTDDGLKRLTSLTKLRTLWLPLRVTDAGLEHLESLKQLRLLELRHTKIDGTGLVHLLKLPELREVILPNRLSRLRARRLFTN